MCPGWRKLPGRCCGVLLLLLVLLLLPLVAPIPTKHTLSDAPSLPQPQYPPDNPISEYPTQRRAQHWNFHRSKRKQRRNRTGARRRGSEPTYFISTEEPPPSPTSSSFFFQPILPSFPSDEDSPSSLLPNLSSAFTPYLDNNLLQNLGIPPSGETSSNTVESQRNTRSAFGNTTRNFRHHHQVRFQLYSVSAWHLLQLLPNGTVGLTADENDPYTFLRIQPIQMQQPYTIRFRSVATGIYLCMNSKGRLYTSCNRSSECEFLSRIEKTFYTTLESKDYSRRYIAINSDRRIKRARRLRGKPLIEDHFFLEFKRPLESTDEILRKAFPPNSSPLQHCADYTPTFVKDRQRLPSKPIGSREQSGTSSSPTRKSKPASSGSSNPKERKGRKCVNKKCRRRRCKSKRCRERRRRRRKYKKQLKLNSERRNQSKDAGRSSSNSSSSSSSSRSSSSSSSDRSDSISSIINNSKSNSSNNSKSNKSINLNNSKSRNLKKVKGAGRRHKKPKTIMDLNDGEQSPRPKQMNGPATSSNAAATSSLTSKTHRIRHKHRLRPSKRKKARVPNPSRRLSASTAHPAYERSSSVRLPEGNTFLSTTHKASDDDSDDDNDDAFIPKKREGPVSDSLPSNSKPALNPPFRTTPSSSPHKLRHMRKRNKFFRKRPRGRNAVIKH